MRDFSIQEAIDLSCAISTLIKKIKIFILLLLLMNLNL